MTQRQTTKPRTLTRRSFLGRAVASTAGAFVTPSLVSPGVVAAAGKPGANDRVRIGFIGTGHRARLLISQTPKEGQIVAISDADLRRCDRAIKERNGGSWSKYQDYRQILDRKDIDAVIVPTHDHGRVLPCIHACQAGKDIYAEKPLSLTIAEGRALGNAVRRHDVVFQTGTQQRSMEMNRYACELVRTGGIGKVHTVIGVNYGGPRLHPELPGTPIPKELDWDMWCGQTELNPFNHRLFGSWMAWRAYSGGTMTNWGAHGLDQVQWALGMDGTGPVEVWPENNEKYAPVTFRYANGVLVKLELADGPKGGAIFIGDKGKIEIDRNRFKATPEDLVTEPPEPQTAEIWEGPGWQAKYHIGNWLDCIKTRELPVADVEVGHRSVTVCHLGNIAREVGHKLQWDPKREIFPNDPAANRYLDRPRRRGYEIPSAT